jgi:hypothetical protein
VGPDQRSCRRSTQIWAVPRAGSSRKNRAASGSARPGSPFFAVDGYLAGSRAGGWAGSDDAVRTAIYASGAAKYSWFGPAMAVRAARDDLGRSSYRQDTSAAAAIRRLTPLVTLIADWADQITALR